APRTSKGPQFLQIFVIGQRRPGVLQVRSYSVEDRLHRAVRARELGRKYPPDVFHDKSSWLVNGDDPQIFPVKNVPDILVKGRQALFSCLFRRFGVAPALETDTRHSGSAHQGIGLAGRTTNEQPFVSTLEAQL